ncbi:MAG: hypothetical protein MJ158_01130 [Alphaproteobacteria bacterium]|nr:hypothetical protein [Alphaproteobacteria bacterium]
MKDKLKKFFTDFRKTTPKYIQWLLLGAAFLVVIILLTLIITHNKSKNSVDGITENKSIEFKITPKKLDLSKTIVDTTKNETIKIETDESVIIDSVAIKESVDEITIKHDCIGTIKGGGCSISVKYAPTTEQKQETIDLSIIWHIDGQSTNNEVVKITFSAIKKEEPKKEQKKTEPVVEPEPEPEPVIEKKEVETITEPEPVVEPEPIAEPEPVVEPEPTEKIIEKEIKEIIPNRVFKDEKKEEFHLPSESCSDYAIAGYNQSGVQIGWIKPEHGANYFYPFEDKECKNPTGKYDSTTGIITSLEDNSRIGTDADHIGYRNIQTRNITMPELSEPQSTQQTGGYFADDAVWVDSLNIEGEKNPKRYSSPEPKSWEHSWTKAEEDKIEKYTGSSGDEKIVNSMPYDRTFTLRQFKPIPATIVSEVRADPSVYNNSEFGNTSLPVKATVDRNIYSDNGRTIIIPTGTVLMGYLDGNLPGPYKSIGRMNIKWYQFIRPDGVEYNFPDDGSQDPYSADAQGRAGVPGHGSTDYIESMVMPLLTAIVPAAVNMIAPIADTFVNQIDLDKNTVVQSGTVRSSELAKQELISSWNKVAQKLLVDAIDNTVPPFSIAAGTRITVYSPVDLILTCGNDGDKKCAFTSYDTTTKRRSWASVKTKTTIDKSDGSWTGQVQSFNMDSLCKGEATEGTRTIDQDAWEADTKNNYDYRTVKLYCESQNYKSINALKDEIYRESQNKKGIQGHDADGNKIKLEVGTQEYNEQVLGIKYDDEGYVENPWETKAAPVAPAEETLTCEDGSNPDANGCCTGETYTDMGDQGFNCCPDSGGDCFPPLI